MQKLKKGKRKREKGRQEEIRNQRSILELFSTKRMPKTKCSSPPCSLRILVCHWPTLSVWLDRWLVICWCYFIWIPCPLLLFHWTIPWNRKSHGNWSAGGDSETHRKRLQEEALKRESEKERVMELIFCYDMNMRDGAENYDEHHLFPN